MCTTSPRPLTSLASTNSLIALIGQLNGPNGGVFYAKLAAEPPLCKSITRWSRQVTEEKPGLQNRHFQLYGPFVWEWIPLFGTDCKTFIITRMHGKSKVRGEVIMCVSFIKMLQSSGCFCHFKKGQLKTIKLSINRLTWNQHKNSWTPIGKNE